MYKFNLIKIKNTNQTDQYQTDQYTEKDKDDIDLIAQSKKIGVPQIYKKWQVGKNIGTQVWIHKSVLKKEIENKNESHGNFCYFGDISQVHLNQCLSSIPLNFEWDLFKYDLNKQTMSFIQYSNFNNQPEPSGGNCLVFSNNKFRMIQASVDPWILHHKFLTVYRDYNGFDWKQSLKRSILWKTKLGIDKQTSCKIGKKSYWEDFCKKNKIPVV